MDIHLVVLTVQLFVEARGRTPVSGGDDTNSGGFGDVDDTTTSGGGHFDNDGDDTSSGGGHFNNDGDDTSSGGGHFDNSGDDTSSGGGHFDNDGDDTSSGGHFDNGGGDDTSSSGGHFDNGGHNTSSGGGHFDNDGHDTSSGGHFDNGGDDTSSGCFDDGDDTNSNGGRCLGNKTPSPEPVERDDGTCCFHQRNYEEQLRLSADTTSDGNTMLELVDHASGQLAAGFLSSNANCLSQTHGGGHVGIDMPPHEQAQLPAPVKLIKAIWHMSLITLVPAISTALYKQARGVVFGHNKLSYYLVLSFIVIAGLGEAFTAFWLSLPGGGSRRRLTFGRAVLCASILPFAAVLGIARYGFIQG